MIDPLYQKEILRLAATATAAGTLESPTNSSDVRNPLCGDRVSINLRLSAGKVSEFAHKTRACVLCQASASLLGDVLPGLPVSAASEAREAVQKFLTGTGTLEGVFGKFEIFEPVKPHTARHSCILLPFDAVIAAVNNPPEA